MPKQKIRVIATIPGAANLGPILAQFGRGGAGIVTSFTDSGLRALSSLATQDSKLTFELFGAVAGQLLTLSGGRSVPLAQAGHIQAAVTEACFRLPDDSFLAAAAGFSGTHRRVASAISELREWGLDADGMSSAVDRCGGTLAEKLKSLAFVDREVSDSLLAIARERNTDRLAASMNLQADIGELNRVLILGGSNLTASQIDWLNWLADLGLNVTLVVDRGADGTDLFRSLEAPLSRLRGETRKSGNSNVFLQRLFAGKAPGEDGPPGPEVRIVSAADPLAETEWALRSAMEDIEEGTREDRIAIFCRNSEAYVPLLEATAMRFGIRVSSSQRLPLLSNSFARLTLDVLEFCAGEDVRAIGNVLWSSYLPLDEAKRESIELGVKGAYREREGQWEALQIWAEGNEAEAPWLRSLLTWRKSSLQEPANLTTWCQRFEELGHRPWHEEALNPASRTCERDGYAQSVLQRSLAQYASIERTRGGRQYTLRQFVRQCKRIWEEAEVSTPSKAGAITVVSSTMEIGNVESLYVVGMLEGVFPRRRSEDPILTDEDRAAISALFPDRIPLANSHDKARCERDEFYRLCAAPSRKLVLSYPQTDDDRDNVRAFYLVEVERALGDRLIFENRPRTQLAADPPRIEGDIKLSAAMRASREKPLPNSLATPEASALISEAANHELTPQDLSEMLECPFHYVAERSLGLRPNRSRSRWYHLFRLPLRTGLATIDDEGAAQSALDHALEAELSSLFSDTSPHDLALIRAGGKRLIAEWLEREFRSRELWPRETVVDRPSFEHGHMRSKLKADEGFVLLKGELPALSVRNGYHIVHLFKASEPWDENSTREENPWNRLKPKEAFELGLYLVALLNGQRERVGLDVDSASGARNLFLMPRPDAPFKNEQLNGFKVTVLDRDLRMDLLRRVGEEVQTAIRRIKRPEVGAQPGEQCRTCEYGELCRRSREFGEEVDPFEPNEVYD